MNIKGAHVVFHRLLKTSKGSSVSAVLLCKRTQDAPMHPGYWGIVGGKVDACEQPKTAALREVKEELGITLSRTKLKSLCDVRIRRDTRADTLGVRYFIAALDLGMDKLTLRYNSEEGKVEGEGLGWFTAEEIHHMWLRPEDRIAVTKFFERSGL